MKQAIVSTAYLGSIHYYSVFASFKKIVIEQYDSYAKQTYRNRCSIMCANGKLNLSIPIEKVSGTKQLVRQVRIDYATRWQTNHWRSIFSAYNSSPFFEYYAPDFVRFYEKKWKYLIDFNTELQQFIMNELDMDLNFELSSGFETDFEGCNFREVITPKKQALHANFDFSDIEYGQTFSDRFGFLPNLSVIDLLFNMGPEAAEVIKSSGRISF